MVVPVGNIVDQVDLTQNDVLLPLLECVVNSIISLHQSSTPKEKRKIQIQVIRGELPGYTQSNLFEKEKAILSYKIIDNGVGFTKKNFQSFKTPYSQTHKEKYGCKGFGRFTVLAAFEEIFINSQYEENGKYQSRIFRMKNDNDNEIEELEFREIAANVNKTTIEINNCNNPIILNNSALSTNEIAESIMNHCLIYHLSGTLPRIEVLDEDKEGERKVEVVNELFDNLSKEKEREFRLKNKDFRLYITKTLKKGNRTNNYLHYCANSRVVGRKGRNLKHVNSIFSYPLSIDSNQYLLDIYLVSSYLDSKVYQARNGFKIPKESENVLFPDSKTISFTEIDKAVSDILEEEYQKIAKTAKKRSIERYQKYIRKNPRYHSFLNNKDVLDSIPPGLKTDKLEEYLYKVSYTARKKVEEKIEEFIEDKEVSEESIEQIKKDIKEKTAYDVDSLADYMMRRQAILQLFDKFLDADENGKYKLEEDVHNLIFPMGLTRRSTDYENHNLWLLDERFINYKFIASDKTITSFSQKKSSQRPDLILIDNPEMFDNPIGFGDKSEGEVNSMVIFEFKRPGEIAHQKNKTDYRWQFSDLIEKYFDDFLYKDVKKNYRGNQVILQKTSPKFGYVILDFIPPKLADYNQGKGWNKTPFGSFYKIIPNLNLHIEVLTFRQLLESCRTRHNPFFNKLFT